MQDSLLSIGVYSLMIGFLCLFVVPALTFWLLPIGAGLVYAYSKTSQAKGKKINALLVSYVQDRLLPIGIGLIIFGFLYLFFIPIMGFGLLAIGIGLVYAHSKTPQAKEQKNQFQAAQQAAVERGKVLNNRFQNLINNPSDAESLEYVLSTLASQDQQSLKVWMRPIVIPLLKVRPLDSVVRDTVLAYAKKAITIRVVGQNEASSKDVYEAALEILSQHPDQIPLKQYALEVGRWHYGIQRSNRRVTIYDEQAIQNDISVRSK